MINLEIICLFFLSGVKIVLASAILGSVILKIGNLLSILLGNSLGSEKRG